MTEIQGDFMARLYAEQLLERYGAVRLEGRGIQPGDRVEFTSRPDLDDREVCSVGKTWLTLLIGDRETPRLPKDNYRVVRLAGTET